MGEVSRGHPLVAFGGIANWFEARTIEWVSTPLDTIRIESNGDKPRLLLAGLLSWLLLVLLPSLLLLCMQSFLGSVAATIVGVIVLYFCIGGRSLAEHAEAVRLPLSRADLDSAREQLGRIVSRDTHNLDEHSVTKGAIESVLENGSDALLAPIFWFVVAGAPGVLCYRLSNTLDAMWGYRNQHYLYFGRVAARMDDVLNWLPARCCAFSYALAGQWRGALRCWRQQASLCDSPNAGPVMASGAGSLGILLGGGATYNNEPHLRPVLGEGRQPVTEDIRRALGLLRRALVIWVLAIVTGEFLLWL
jgi:adenosylcobinamide-phosphate synthase